MKMILTTLFLPLLFSFTMCPDFLSQQKEYSRVATAIKEKKDHLEKMLKEKQLTLDNFNMLIIAYKDNDLMEIYVKSKQATAYQKFLSYNICSRSGKLGPKRQQGDQQVPEGFYYIEKFNPTSNFYLSLGLNYPNRSDKIKGIGNNLGGDIYIHGSCVTIGCMPMTDEYIKEIYLLAVYAKNNCQSQIPVYIFPFQMTDQNMKVYKLKYSDNPLLITFWENVKKGYDKFFRNFEMLKVNVDAKGNYVFN